MGLQFCKLPVRRHFYIWRFHFFTSLFELKSIAVLGTIHIIKIISIKKLLLQYTCVIEFIVWLLSGFYALLNINYNFNIIFNTEAINYENNRSPHFKNPIL